MSEHPESCNCLDCLRKAGGLPSTVVEDEFDTSIDRRLDEILPTPGIPEGLETATEISIYANHQARVRTIKARFKELLFAELIREHIELKRNIVGKTDMDIVRWSDKRVDTIIEAAKADGLLEAPE
jgi:hypothetical protein